jgi:hypothetical protein
MIESNIDTNIININRTKKREKVSKFINLKIIMIIYCSSFKKQTLII